MKLNELWIAFAGNQLTSTVSTHAFGDGSMAKIVIKGVFDESSSVITNIILSAIEGGNHKYCLIDVQELLFVSGISINEYAIECLVRLTSYVMSHGINGVLVVDDGYVREVLTGTLRRRRGFSRMTIESGEEFARSDLAQLV